MMWPGCSENRRGLADAAGSAERPGEACHRQGVSYQNHEDQAGDRFFLWVKLLRIANQDLPMIFSDLIVFIG